MQQQPKLSAEERRAAITQAAQRVFADKGFHGTTTRALAEAAGVSEALLFKHFPTKQALFAAIQMACCDGQDIGKFQRLHSLEPSCATLVLLVHFLVTVTVGRAAQRDNERAIPVRLLLRSLAEDGEFARELLRCYADNWVPKVEECLRAAAA